MLGIWEPNRKGEVTPKKHFTPERIIQLLRETAAHHP